MWGDTGGEEGVWASDLGPSENQARKRNGPAEKKSLAYGLNTGQMCSNFPASLWCEIFACDKTNVRYPPQNLHLDWLQGTILQLYDPARKMTL